MSKIGKKIAGTYIADQEEPKPSVMAWLQTQCRYGVLRSKVDALIKERQETLDADLLLITDVNADQISFKVPCRLYDHENRSPFYDEVAFVLRP